MSRARRGNPASTVVERLEGDAMIFVLAAPEQTHAFFDH
jgi:hypothetical protein